VSLRVRMAPLCHRFSETFLNRTERLYAIVEELRAAAPSGRSSAWLADRFEVSTRTIKRDIAALERVGVALYGTEGRGGGYHLPKTARLPPLSFTIGEATALAIAVASEPDLPFGTDGRAAMVKILGAMQAGQRAAVSRLAGKVWMRTPPWEGRSPVFRVIEEALRDEVVVNVDHRAEDGRITRRRPVEPLGLARTHGHWYLMAWCRKADAARWFRLDRIVRAHATHERLPARDVLELFGPAPDDAQPVRIEPT
jgi:predicted DNA-binding transcriptional regulator YafY